MTRKRFMVMGNPIGHSLSPQIHQKFAEQMGLDITYETCLLDDMHFEQQVRDFFDAGGAGLNITSPGKVRAYAMADVKTPRCIAAGAANTLWCDQAGTLCADNTDGVGLVRDLMHKGMPLTGVRVLVLGAGGAVRGILPALLAKHPAEIVLANRTVARAEALVQQLGSDRLTCMLLDEVVGAYDLIIHATLASVFDRLPQEKLMLGEPLCYDLNYHGVLSSDSMLDSTDFVGWATSCGFKAVDGLGMLIEQAAEAFYVWHGVRPSTSCVID